MQRLKENSLCFLIGEAGVTDLLPHLSSIPLQMGKGLFHVIPCWGVALEPSHFITLLGRGITSAVIMPGHGIQDLIA